jgi:protein-tyrosine phosphatase
MKHLVDRKGLNDDFEIDSAGIISHHKGENADNRMIQHASNRGYNLTSISRPVDPKHDFEYFDMIIGMDNDNIYDLQNMVPDKKYIDKIFLMTQFLNNVNYSIVPDPYYGGSKGFELVLDLLENACECLINQIITNEILTIKKRTNYT